MAGDGRKSDNPDTNVIADTALCMSLNLYEKADRSAGIQDTELDDLRTEIENQPSSWSEKETTKSREQDLERGR